MSGLGFGWRRCGGSVGAPLLAVAVLGAMWWTATEVAGARPFILPSPRQVGMVFVEHAGYLWRGTRTTALEAGSGFVLAVGIGLVLGVLLASWPPLARATLPLLVGLDAVPKLALAVPLVVWLGLGLTPKIVLVVTICLLPIVLSTMYGLLRTPAEQVEYARSCRASWWHMLVKVRFPFALPRVFVGLKLAAPLCVIGAVIGEFFGALAGLGYAIRAAGADMAIVYAAMLLLAAMSLVVFGVVAGIERLLTPWAREIHI